MPPFVLLIHTPLIKFALIVCLCDTYAACINGIYHSTVPFSNVYARQKYISTVIWFFEIRLYVPSRFLYLHPCTFCQIWESFSINRWGQCGSNTKHCVVVIHYVFTKNICQITVCCSTVISHIYHNPLIEWKTILLLSLSVIAIVAQTLLNMHKVLMNLSKLQIYSAIYLSSKIRTACRCHLQ